MTISVYMYVYVYIYIEYIHTPICSEGKMGTSFPNTTLPSARCRPAAAPVLAYALKRLQHRGQRAIVCYCVLLCATVC